MKSFILIKILKTKGSAPCDTSSSIIFYDKNKFKGTIGGGSLENQALDFASNLQTSDTNYGFLEISLSPKIKQCCGGVVSIVFLKFLKNESILKKIEKLRKKQKPFILISDYRDNKINRHIIKKNKTKENIEQELLKETKKLLENNTKMQIYKEKVFLENFNFSNHKNIVIYGAGHIARHLVKILSKLSFNVYLVDNRENEFLKFKAYKKSKSKITFILQDYLSSINKLKQNPYHLIMTYDHSYDYEITKILLQEDKIKYIGLIGSNKKANRFKKILKKEDIKQENLLKLECPIGGKISYKQPFVIALSIALNLLKIIKKI